MTAAKEIAVPANNDAPAAGSVLRPQSLFSLFADVTRIKGVGPAVKKLLQKLLGKSDLEAVRVKDLLFHIPVSAIDRRHMPPLGSAKDGEIITAVVTVELHEPPPAGATRKGVPLPYKVRCHNESGYLNLVFFNARADYLTRMLPVGQQRVVSGVFQVTQYGWQMPHPDFIVPVAELEKVKGFEPVYPLTAGLSNKQLLKIMTDAQRMIPDLPEWIDEGYLKQQQWSPWKSSFEHIHRPESLEETLPSSALRQRVAYDEALAGQLALAITRKRLKRAHKPPLAAGGAMVKAIVEQLPFTLTAAQQLAWKEIEDDLCSGERMLRMLQGDVGSGKTVLALLAMVRMAESGQQSALMVPTEILAMQHVRFIAPLCAAVGIKVGTLTGSTSASAYNEAADAVASGVAHIVIGTHALFQQNVTFSSLGLIVVDEQHRFGVSQRLTLAEKGGQPHILQMTATPIPRSLTMTYFGDMDCSVLAEKPPGRKPVDTRAVPLSRADEVIEGIKRAIDEGNRVYWICPLVEERDEADIFKADLAAAESRYIEFQKRFGKDIVGMVHGRVKPEARHKVMRQFADGDCKLLVATTVVEVGVHVPEATIMVIEHAERFGLSQLHQLRGRVGRGEKPSRCILLYTDQCGDVAKARLRIMRETEDGFRIAEEDLRIRGGGEVLGTRQSGMPDFRFVNLAEHTGLILAARDDVKLIMHRDPGLESPRGQALRCLLHLFDYEENIRYLGSG